MVWYNINRVSAIKEDDLEDKSSSSSSSGGVLLAANAKQAVSGNKSPSLLRSPPKPGSSILPALQITETDYSGVKSFPDFKAAASEIAASIAQEQQETVVSKIETKKADVALETYYVSAHNIVINIVSIRYHLFLGA